MPPCKIDRLIHFAAALLTGTDLTECDLRGSTIDFLDPLAVTLRGAIVDVQQAPNIAQGLGLDVRS